MFIEFVLGQFQTFCVQHTLITVTPPSLFSLFYSCYLSYLQGLPVWQWVWKYPLELGGLLSVYTSEEDDTCSLSPSVTCSSAGRGGGRTPCASLYPCLTINRPVVGSHPCKVISALVVQCPEDSIHCPFLIFRLFISFPHPLLQ